MSTLPEEFTVASPWSDHLETAALSSVRGRAGACSFEADLCWLRRDVPDPGWHPGCQGADR